MPTRRFFLLLIGCVFCLALTIAISPSARAQLIPSISGRVVDAVTGQPVQGINVALHASRYEGWSVDVFLNDDKLTGPSGEFQFPALALEPSSLMRFGGYWLTVNTDHGDSTGTDERTDSDVLYNPMANRRGQPVGNKNYFPLTIAFTPNGCDVMWKATCVSEKSNSSLSIQIIPVFDGPEACGGMQNPLQEHCRQLNTYRAAFLHVDTYEEVQSGKELCMKLPSPQIAQPCLYQLELYVGNAAYDRPIKPQVDEPIPPGMFPDAVAGVPVIKGHCGPKLAFSGSVTCSAGYGTQRNFLVAISIEESPESEPSTKPPLWNPQYSDHEEATVTEETLSGSKVLRYRGPQYNAFYWHSAGKNIDVVFYHPIPQLDPFVSYYLTKFPSTFQ